MWAPNLTGDVKSKYRAIASAIADDVASGALQPGQRLPTQRALSKQLSVTIGTVGRAYALAEKRGLISLEVGRGSFVRSIHSTCGSTVEQSPIIDFGLNLPPATENPELFSQVLADLSHSRNLRNLFGHAPIQGFESHRVAAASWLASRLPCSADDILIANGTQNALVATLSALVGPGGSVMVEELTFPGMIEAARLLNIQLVGIPMDKGGIRVDELDRLCKTSRVLYLTPVNQNPTTTTLSITRRKKLVRVAQTRSITIIEDDAYGKLLDKTPVSIASLAPENTVMISSLSKTLAVGLRIAFMYVPDSIRDKVSSRLRAAQFFPCPLSCEIASHWINSPVAEQLVVEMRDVSTHRQKIAHELLGDFILGQPAGHHVWLELPEPWTGDTFQRAAKEAGVLLYSGSDFAVEPDVSLQRVRIGLGRAANEIALREGLGKLKRLLQEQSGSPPGAQY